MSVVVVDTRSVRIPERVSDLAAFRRWVRSPAFPESGRICYLGGEVWIDMSKEQLTNNQVKGEIGSVLSTLIKLSRLGRFFPGYLLTNLAADLSTNPDGIFVSTRTLRTRLVRLAEGAEEGYVELEGTPDMVLEVISPSSVEKDTAILLDLYWRAGIREYWLVDVRGERCDLQIHRRGTGGYSAVRQQAGWCRSAVFRKAFRLTRRDDALGYPKFTLEMR